MVSSTGHDGPMGASGVKRLSKLGMISGAPGMGALDMNSAEDAVVRTLAVASSVAFSSPQSSVARLHIKMSASTPDV